MKLLSLRELMLLVAVVAFGTAGLFLDSWAASAFLAFILLLVTVLAVHACVGHGRTRAFCFGFVVSAICYVTACLFYSTCLRRELDNSLIGSSIIYPAYEQVVRREYIDRNTGQPLAANDPNRTQQLPAGGYIGVSGGSILVTESPNRDRFVMTFHVLIAVAFAYIFGKVAILVDSSGKQTSSPESDEP